MSINRRDVRVGLEQRLHHLPAFVAGEVSGLGRQDLHARDRRRHRSSLERPAKDQLVKALLAVDRWVRAGRAFQFDDPGIAAGGANEPFGCAPALIDEIGADEGDVITARHGDVMLHVAVNQDHRDAGLLRLKDGRSEWARLAGREDEDVGSLGDHRGDIGDLLRGVLVGVGRDELVPALRRLVLHALSFGEAPRVVAPSLAEAHRVGVLLRQWRKFLRPGPLHKPWAQSGCAGPGRREFEEMTTR